MVVETTPLQLDIFSCSPISNYILAVHGDLETARIFTTKWLALAERTQGGELSWTLTNGLQYTAVFFAMTFSNFIHRWAGLADVGARYVRLLCA